MTQETCMVIDLSDIGTVRFECSCGASKHFQFANDAEVPGQCHQCDKKWIDVGMKSYEHVRDLLKSLQELRKLDTGNCRIRLTVPVK